MRFDPRGPVLPILCCCLVVVFLLTAMDTAPVSGLTASVAAPVAGIDVPKSDPAINVAASMPDSLVAFFNEVAGTDAAEIVLQSLVRDNAVSIVVTDRPPTFSSVAAPVTPGRSPIPRAPIPRAQDRANESVPRVDRFSGPAPPSSTDQPAIIQAPPSPASSASASSASASSEARPALASSSLSVSKPGSPLPLDNANWRIISGQVVGQSRNGAQSPESSSGGDRSLEILGPGGTIADGAFRVPGHAVVAPGPGAGLVSFHGVTGRLGGEGAGYWISLLDGSIDWDGCDGGTIICMGMRLRGDAQARFSVVMNASGIRITVVSGRVHVAGALEPITVNPNETIIITRDGQVHLGDIRNADADSADARGVLR